MGWMAPSDVEIMVLLKPFLKIRQSKLSVGLPSFLCERRVWNILLQISFVWAFCFASVGEGDESV